MTRAARRRRSSRLVLGALAAVTALVATACSDGHTDLRAIPSAGWPSYGGNYGNTNFAYPSIADDLTASWSRPTGGPVTAPIAINGGGDVAVTSRPATGCSLLVLDHRAGRKNFCKKMRDGFNTNTVLYDQLSQPYIGEPGMFLALNGGGAIRWRMPTVGMAQSAKFAGPGRVLVTTTQGQILLLDTQTGEFAAPEVRLRAAPDLADPSAGLRDCPTGGAGCAIAAPPAVDPGRERLFLNFFPDGAKAAQVKAMSFAERDGHAAVVDLWTAEVGGGMVGPPALSADGTTLYVFGRDGRLSALDAGDGRVRWSHDLGGFGFATLAASPDGLLVPTGAPGAPLVILRDSGSSVREVVRRDDVRTAGLGTLTAANTLWSVVRGPNGLALTEFSADDGVTRRSLPLPDADGFATGVAVSATGDLVVGTSDGTVHAFTAKP